MKSSMRWFATALAVTALIAALIVTALIAASLAWWLRGRGQQQEHTAEEPQPIITILAEAPGLAPEEMESLVVWPIESQVNGAPGVQCVRSASRQGTCSVWVDLRPNTNVFEARQRLAERLQRANLSPDVTPMLAPISFSEREVVLIGLRSAAKPKTAEERTSDGMNLHTLAEHVVRDRLLAVPGVSQVVVTGGIRKQCQVELDPERLLRFGVTLPQIEQALKENITVGASGNLRRGYQEVPVLVRAKPTSLQDLEATVVVVRDGRPVQIKHIASVRFGGSDRVGEGAIWTKGGAGDHDGGPAVILTVLSEPNTESGKIDRLLSELQQILPPDTKLERQTFTQEDISVSLQLPAGTSRNEQDQLCRLVEAALMDVPEIQSVWRRGQTAESLGWADGLVMFIALQTKAERGREMIRADIRERIAGIPGISANLGQPVSQQLGCAGMYAQIAVKVFGPDLQDLQRTAREILDRMRTVPGVVDLQVEPGGESPRLQIDVKRDQAARYGVPVADLIRVVEMGLQGRVVGEVLHEGRHLDLVVMYDEKLDRDLDAIARLLVKTATGESIPVGALAYIFRTAGPVTVYRENMQRRIVVSCNVQGRDRTAVLTDIREALKSAEEKLARGYRIEYAGCALAPGP